MLFWSRGVRVYWLPYHEFTPYGRDSRYKRCVVVFSASAGAVFLIYLHKMLRVFHFMNIYVLLLQ